tara:strand:- start:1470 stop:1802 length:333 start_codon:yes stop_codon:yes gene_type:complete
MSSLNLLAHVVIGNVDGHAIGIENNKGFSGLSPLFQIAFKFGLNGCRDQLLRSRSQQICQRVRHPVSTCKIKMLVVSMVAYLLYLGCCLATTIQPDTPPTFKPSKHLIQS